MTCEEFRARFPDYAAGRLPDTLAAAIEVHLEGCPACEASLSRDAAPLDEARTLPRAVSPAYDLWPGIEARLAPRALPGRIVVPRWMLAAAAILLIAVSSAVTAVVLRQPPGHAAVQQPTSLEAEYAAASEDLLRALDQARARLSPETIATIEKSLHLIDAALDESRRALAKDPGNQALSRLVVAAWRQKVDLLRRAAALVSAG